MTKKKKEEEGEKEREREKNERKSRRAVFGRKYVAVGIPFTSWICFFNAAIKNDVSCEKFDVLSLRHCGVSISQTVTKEKHRLFEKPAKNDGCTI